MNVPILADEYIPDSGILKENTTAANKSTHDDAVEGLDGLRFSPPYKVIYVLSKTDLKKGLIPVPQGMPTQNTNTEQPPLCSKDSIRAS